MAYNYNTWYGIEVICPGAAGMSFDLVDDNGDVIVSDYLTFNVDNYAANFGLDLPVGRFYLINNDYIINSDGTGSALVVLIEDPDGDSIADWGYYGSCYLAEKTITPDPGEDEEDTSELVPLVQEIRDYQESFSHVYALHNFYFGVIFAVLIMKIFWDRWTK